MIANGDIEIDDTIGGTQAGAGAAAQRSVAIRLDGLV